MNWVKRIYKNFQFSTQLYYETKTALTDDHDDVRRQVCSFGQIDI